MEPTHLMQSKRNIIGSLSLSTHSEVLSPSQQRTLVSCWPSLSLESNYGGEKYQSREFPGLAERRTGDRRLAARGSPA